MSGRDQQGAPDGRRRRPRLLTFLTVLMLLVGGPMLIGSMSDLHRVWSGQPDTFKAEGNFTPEQEGLLRIQLLFSNALLRYKPVVLSLHAVARLGLGLLYLFAVAAVFSDDRRGRRVSLLAGWAGLSVSIANVFYLIFVVRGMLPWLLPGMSEAFGKGARDGSTAPPPESVAQQAHMLLVDLPMLATGLGVVFSLVLLAYFASRNVRLFYNQPRQADHG
jgi:hypothetical protein